MDIHMTVDNYAPSHHQSVSEFTSYVGLEKPLVGDLRQKAISDTHYFETQAVTRHHYYGLTLRWKDQGNFNRALFWTEQLVDRFSPCEPLVAPEGDPSILSDSILISDIFDPSTRQFISLLIDFDLMAESNKLLLRFSESYSGAGDLIECAMLWHRAKKTDQALALP